MNWNCWLPWRDYPQDDTNDSTYEEKVIERCDHDFEQSQSEMLYPNLADATFEDGFLIVPQYEVFEEFCTKCGKLYNGEYRQLARKLAFKPDFILDPDRSVSDAITKEEEPGRVIVNESEYGGID